MDRYKQEVIDPGDRVSKLAHKVCIESFNNSKAVIIIPRQPGNFRGAVDFNFRRPILKAMMAGQAAQTIQNDGAGGKPQFFTLVGDKRIFRGLGWEIITMCADDIARTGGFPAVMINQVDVKKITTANLPLIEAMLEGYGDALEKAGLVNLTGETAVMKHSVTAFCDGDSEEQLVLTLTGACLGVVHKEKTIDGSKIGPGQPIVGLFEPGYRCNGGTFFTNLLVSLFGEGDPKKVLKNKEALKFARKLTIPSKSYARLISKVHGWKPDGEITEPLVKITGIAHITGGGVWAKFGEILPESIGAILDNMPEPPAALLEGQKLSYKVPELKLTDLQAYGTLHGGCGMMVICESKSDADRLIGAAGSEGVRASVIGRTVLSAVKEITIHSRFKEKKILSSAELAD